MLSWVPVGAICCRRGGGGGGRGEPLSRKKTLASRPNFYETVEEEQGSYDKLT